MSESDFSDWSQKQFAHWLRKNYPDPKTRWVEVTLSVQHAPDEMSEYTMADSYEICIAELARALEIEVGHSPGSMSKEEAAALGIPEGDGKWTFLIRPANRRKKKQMWLRTSSM